MVAAEAKPSKENERRCIMYIERECQESEDELVDNCCSQECCKSWGMDMVNNHQQARHTIPSFNQTEELKLMA